MTDDWNPILQRLTGVRPFSQHWRQLTRETFYSRLSVCLGTKFLGKQLLSKPPKGKLYLSDCTKASLLMISRQKLSSHFHRKLLKIVDRCCRSSASDLLAYYDLWPTRRWGSLFYHKRQEGSEEIFWDHAYLREWSPKWIIHNGLKLAETKCVSEVIDHHGRWGNFNFSTGGCRFFRRILNRHSAADPLVEYTMAKTLRERKKWQIICLKCISCIY